MAFSDIERARLAQIQGEIQSARSRASVEPTAARGEDMGRVLEGLRDVLAQRRAEATAAGETMPAPDGPARYEPQIEGGFIVAKMTRCGDCADSGLRGGVEREGPNGLTYSFTAPCDCRRVRRRAKLIDAAKLPARHVGSRFESYDLHRESDEGDEPERRRAALELAQATVKGAGHPGLLLAGTPGVGKTHLLVSCARALINADVAVRYVTWPEILDLAFAGVRSDGPKVDVVAEFVAPQVLVLDELGAGRATEFEQGLINRLIVRRYDTGRGIVAATNYALTPGPGGLVSRMGAHAYDRLREMCRAAVLTGASQRKPAGGEGAA